MDTLPPPEDHQSDPPEEMPPHKVSILLHRVSPTEWVEEWDNGTQNVTPLSIETIMAEVSVMRGKYRGYSLRKFPSYILAIVTMEALWHAFLKTSMPSWINIGLIMGWTSGSMASYSRQINNMLLQKTYLKVEDLRCIGPLVTMLRNRDLKDYGTRLAIGVLPPLLRHIRPGDEIGLDESQRRNLYRFLHPNLAYRTQRLAVAILYALKQVDDGSALGTVLHLATVGDGEDSELQVAAQQCADVLTQRVEKQRVGETLLRASVAPETAPSTLLRAAYDTQPIQSDQLLRATLGSSGDASESVSDS